MLDKYKNEQPILYNLLENSIKKDKISHAYLFETNNNPNSIDIVYSFVKELICPNDKRCDNCSICKRIDDGNYLDVKVINPDGLRKAYCRITLLNISRSNRNLFQTRSSAL